MKKLILTLAIGTTSFYSFSQKHIKGTKDVLIGGGLTKLGGYGEIGIHKVLNSRWKVGANVVIESGKEKTIKFNSYYLMPEVRFAPINVKGIFYPNLGAGLLGDYNVISYESTKKKGFNYGGSIFFEPEVYVTDNLIVYGIVRQSYVFGDILHSTIFFGGLGLKLSF